MTKKWIGVLGAFALMSQVLPAWAAAGRTAGAFGTSPAGAANYSMPIFTPPGTGGMSPKLSLAYSSNSGDGIAGMGFQITGFSTITRCARTRAQDPTPGPVSLSAADKFCLDGVRLSVVSGAYGSAGSAYRTELESFARIIAWGSAGAGPLYFIVEQKNGLIYEYGNSTDSRIEPLAAAGGQVATVGSWALNKIRDRSGNTVEFVYEEDATNGAVRPDEIRWTSNAGQGLSAAYKVAFEYEPTPRPDTLYGYRFGNNTGADGKVIETKRLDRIDVYHSNTVVRRYELSYETSGGAGARSRLQSVQECGLGGGDCYSPTTFSWVDGTVSWNAEANTGEVVPAQPLVMDINGDGRDDLVYSSVASGSGYWYYLLASTSGGYNSAVSTGILNSNFAAALPTDWDGDGRWDFLVPYNGTTWWVVRSNGSGFDSPMDTGVAYTSNLTQWWVADVDGDGRGDLLRTQVGPGMPAEVYVRLRSGAGFAGETGEMGISLYPTATLFQPNAFGGLGARARSAIRQPDFNGDGREDYVVHLITSDSEIGYIEYEVCIVNGGSGGAQCYNSTTPIQGWVTADANDDGLTDLYWFSNNQAYLILSRGQWTRHGGAMGSLAGYNIATAVATDWDADGRQDLALVNTSTGTWHVKRATGTGLSAFVNTGISAGAASFVATGDMNGDGLDDLLGANVSDNTWRYSTHQGLKPDLLDQATDGFGVSVNFDYASIAQNNYTKGTGAAFPDERDYQGPTYVVSQYNASDGIGGTYNVSHWYYEAKISQTGRGFEGFGIRRTIDDRYGLRAFDYFHQAFPYTGVSRQSDLYQSNGTTLVSRTVNQWAEHSYGSGYDIRKLPYVSQSTVTRYELGGDYSGALLSTEVTSNSVDSATGTLYDTNSTITEASTANGVNAGQSHTRRVYHSSLLNDTTNWCIGRPQTTEQINSHTSYGGSTLTRTQSTTWSGPSCRPTQVVQQPGDLQWQITTVFGYDGFGNPSSEAVTGIGMPTRTTSTYWGAAGQFPTTLTNALSQTTTIGWDASRGLSTSQMDPNGIITSWQYDAFGRRTREDRPDGTATTLSYSDCSVYGCVSSNNKLVILAAQLNTSGTVVRDEYSYLDRLDRTIALRSQTLSGSYNRKDWEFNDRGHLAREASTCWWASCSFYWTAYTYDTLDRLTQTARPVNDSDPTIQSSTINYQGLIRSTSDPQGNVTDAAYTVTGLVAGENDASGYYVTYDYDAFGNRVRIVDANSNTLESNTLSIQGALTAQTEMNRGAWNYGRNALGELVSQTDALSQTVTFGRDLLGRIATRTSTMPDGTFTEQWNWGTSAAARNIGRLASLSNSWQFQESYTYDSAGRLQTTTVDHFGIGNYQIDRTYDSSGELGTLTYPVSTSGYRLKLQYEYQYGALLRARDFNAPSTIFWTANATDSRGQIIDESLGNGVQTIRGFDQVTGWLDYLQTSPAGNPGNPVVQDLSYEWDKAGNLTQRHDANRSLTEQFYYDVAYRLWYSKRNGVQNFSVTYDALGNIASRSDVGTYTYHSTKKHAVTGTSNGWTFQYNANGQMTRNRQTDLSYYQSGQVFQMNASTASSLFGYTPDGRHVETQTYEAGVGVENIHSIGGILDVVERDTQTEYRHQIRAGGQTIAVYTRRSNGTASTYYVSRDHLGSVDAVTITGGLVVAAESFGAFGQRRGSNWQGTPSASDWTQIRNITRRGFTDHQHVDNLSMIHMNGRVYDPQIARFVSPDPMEFGPGQPQAFNRYSYVLNNPLSFTDPSGFVPLPENLTEADVTAYQERQHDIAQASYNWAVIMAEFGGGYGPYGGGGGSFGGLLNGFIGVNGPLVFPSFSRNPRIWVSNPGAQGTDPGDIEFVKVGKGRWEQSWWDTPNSMPFCGRTCALLGESPAWNTSTNGERVMNVVNTLSFATIGLGGAPWAARALPNSALVVRGGNAANHTAAKINAAIGPSRTPGVTGFSAQCNGGTCLAELGQFLRNKQVGVTTVGEIRQLGGNVIATPGFGHHVTVTGVTGEAASPLFRIVPNSNLLVGP